ncbi:MAG: hypothetical protein HYX87_09500 [Chloroflexi bacterium]|nr:hypothetical protein [Chloroflexota bacterium]
MAWVLHGNQPRDTADVAGTNYQTKLIAYISALKSGLRLEDNVERDVLREICTHVDDRAKELEENGLSPDEAKAEATHLLGPPRILARQLYEAHSQGSWGQTLMAASPHIIFALLFALSWWRSMTGLLMVLGIVILFSAYGWWRGKPRWLFPWLGYLLVPVIIAGVLLVYLPRQWSWLAVFIYLPLAVWLVSRIGRQSLRTDWIYCSVMMFPAPVLASWALAVGWRDIPLDSLDSPLGRLAPWIAASFLALGAAVAVFVRVRQRWLKVGALLMSELAVLILVAISSKGISLLGLSFLALAAVTCLLGPAFLEHMPFAHRTSTSEKGVPSTGYR